MPAILVTSGLASGWRRAQAKDKTTGTAWHDLAPVQRVTQSNWGQAIAADATAASEWRKGTPKDASHAHYFGVALLVDSFLSNQWAKGVAVNANTATPWGEGVASDAESNYPWRQAIAADNTASTAWEYAGIFAAQSTGPIQTINAYSPPLGAAVLLNLAGLYSVPAADSVALNLTTIAAAAVVQAPGYIPPPSFNVGFNLSTEYTQPGALGVDFQLNSASTSTAAPRSYDPITLYPWAAPPAQDVATATPWGKGIAKNAPSTAPRWEVEPGDPLSPAPDPLTIRNSYLIMNNISLVTVQDRTPLMFDSFSVSMDIDSHSYNLDVTLLNEASYNKVVPMTGPVDVELTINGHKLFFMISDGGDGATISGKTWKASGPTRSALLAAPHASKNSKTSAGISDAAAMASAELAGTGFTLNWPTGLDKNAVTWLMPGGVFSYQSLAPIDVIKRLAATVGAVVIPSLTDDTITVQPRWPLLPWALDSDNPDVLIHESMIVSRGNEYTPAQAFNELWVSGETDGFQTRVFITSTGGGIAGPDITDPWLTENPANIQRGAQELAEAAQMLIVSLSVLVMESGGPGVILPGQIMEVQHANPALNWRGLILANNISPGGDGVDLFQNIKVARPV